MIINKKGIVSVSFNGIELGELGEAVLDFEEIKFESDKIEEVRQEDYEIKVVFEISEKEYNRFIKFIKDIIIIPWKRMLAWVAFCVEYFRKN